MKLYSGEQVKDIKGYNGVYKITSFGRVWSCGIAKTRHNKGKFKKLTIAKTGYVLVGLNKNSKLKTVKTSRLIAEAFIDNPNKKPEVNHIDGNKENNNILNLEWVTRSENIIHAYKNGLKKSSDKQKDLAREHCRELGKISGKLNGRKNGMKCKVLSFAQDEEIRKKHKSGVSIRKLAMEYNVSCTPIIRAIRNDYVVM